MNKKAWLILIGAGVILRMLPLLEPIHEEMHAQAVMLTGGRITMRLPNHIWWVGSWAPGFVVFMGFTGEALLYGTLALLPRVGLLAYGILWPLPLLALFSTDFERLGPGAYLGFLVVWIAVVAVNTARIAKRFGHKKGAPSTKDAQPMAKLY